MSKIRNVVIRTLLALGLVAGIGVVVPEHAGAAQVVHVQYYGCNTTAWHYQLEEIGMENNGVWYRIWKMDMYDHSGNLWYNDAWYGEAPWPIDISDVQIAWNQCQFLFGGIPGSGYSAAKFIRKAGDNFTHPGWGTWYMGNQWSGWEYGWWNDNSSHISQYTANAFWGCSWQYCAMLYGN